MRPFLCTVLALALTAAACGGDAGDAERQDYVDALAAEITADDEVDLSATESRCFADQLIDAIGIDYLRARDIGPRQLAESDDDLDLPDLSEGQILGIASAFRACDINLFQFMAAEDAEAMTQDALDCLDTRVDDDLLAALFVQELTGASAEAGAELEQRFFEAVLPCAALLED